MLVKDSQEAFVLSSTSFFDGILDQERVTSRKQHAGGNKQVRISS